MFPKQAKIELFARSPAEGWDRWGLEIPESDAKILTGAEESP